MSLADDCFTPSGSHSPLHESPDGPSPSLQTLQDRLAQTGRARIAASHSDCIIAGRLLFLAGHAGTCGRADRSPSSLIDVPTREGHGAGGVGDIEVVGSHVWPMTCVRHPNAAHASAWYAIGA
jgi:hypothetical protein